MNRSALFGLLYLALLVGGPIGADYVTEIDGTKAHTFFVAQGSDLYIVTEGGTVTLLGTANGNDFDFDGDGDADWAKVTGVHWVSTGAAGNDSLGYHGRSGGSSGFGWHETHLPAGADVNLGLDLKLFSRIAAMGTTAKRDTVLRVKAVTGDIHLTLTGS